MDLCGKGNHNVFGPKLVTFVNSYHPGWGKEATLYGLLKTLSCDPYLDPGSPNTLNSLVSERGSAWQFE